MIDFSIVSTFIQHNIDIINIILITILVVSALVITGIKLYKIYRPRFTIKVNCWFCNENNIVPYKKKNAFHCKYCEQYNGFNEDGGYNKVIAAQRDEYLNRRIVSVEREAYEPSNNILCRKCNLNQELKVQQLSSFQPIDISRYDEEIEIYKKRLENAYKLCDKCEYRLKEKLENINKFVQQQYGTNGIMKATTQETNNKIKKWLKNFCLVLTGIIYSVNLILLLICLFNEYLHIGHLIIHNDILFVCSQWELYLIISFIVLNLLIIFARKKVKTKKEILSIGLWILHLLLHQELFNVKIDLINLKWLAVSRLIIGIATWYLSLNFILKIIKQNVKLLNKRYIGVFNTTVINSDGSINNGKSPVLNKSLLNCATSSEEVENGISTLSLGKEVPIKSKTNGFVFETRKYESTTSDIFSPKIINNYENIWGPKRRKPVIRPSKLQDSIWQHHSIASLFPVNYNTNSAPFSRSSSQSSGFISQADTNISLPNSRTGSICGDFDRFSVLSEPIMYSATKPQQSYIYVPSPPPGATLLIKSNAPPEIINNPPPKQEIPNKIVEENTKKNNTPWFADNLLITTLLFTSVTFNVVIIAVAVVSIFKIYFAN